MKVLSVVGNRPQFIKSGPVSEALRGREIDEIVLHTGQHYDRELSEVFFEELGLPEPAHRLEVGARPREEMLELLEREIGLVLAQDSLDWVLVYGDTNSTLGGARAAVAAGIPVAHVEAGLRSGDWSMPEEHNRVEVDRIAALLLCPDERSRGILTGEHVGGRAEVVGDVMADASFRLAPIARERSLILERLGAAPGEYVAMTLHREANVQADRLRKILSAFEGSSRRVFFPAHPRTRQTIEREQIRLAPEIQLLEPLGYLDFTALASQASVIVTDSGGLQKEAYWYGVPCITARPSTEWVDTVEVGANVLVDDDPVLILAALADPPRPAERPPLYGDGQAAERVAEALCTLPAS